jgi:hypothetical protein
LQPAANPVHLHFDARTAFLDEVPHHEIIAPEAIARRTVPRHGAMIQTGQRKGTALVKASQAKTEPDFAAPKANYQEGDPL